MTNIYIFTSGKGLISQLQNNEKAKNMVQVIVNSYQEGLFNEVSDMKMLNIGDVGNEKKNRRHNGLNELHNDNIGLVSTQVNVNRKKSSKHSTRYS